MRTRTEQALLALGYFAHRRAWAVIACVVALVVVAGLQLPKLQLKISTDDFLRPDDPVRLAYDDFRERFGRDDMIVVAIDPPEVFERSFLEKLARLHEELEDGVPYLVEVRSLVNARETRGEADRLIVGELLEDWPEDDEALASLRDRALANPLYTDFILSRDAGMTVVTVELEAFASDQDTLAALEGFDDLDYVEEDEPSRALSMAEEGAAVNAVEAVLARYAGPDFRVYAGGAPVLNSLMAGSLMRDISLFTAISIALISLLLAAVFRRVLGVLIPLTVATTSLVLTLGVMGGVGIPLMPVSEIVPSFLLAVGVGGTVHLLVIFAQRLAAGASREDAIAGALAHSGLPIAMTAITTAGGLASFSVADMVPVAVFGLIAPLGLLLTLVITLTLVPALLTVAPYAPASATDERRPPSIRALVRLGDFATTHASRVVVACALLLLAAVAGMLRLEFSFNSLEWFDEAIPARVASDTIDRELGGAMAVELLLDTGRQDGLKDPDVLERLARAQRAATGLEVGDLRAGASVSLADVVMEIHQALNGGRTDMRVVPDDRRLVAQELLLFENSGSDDLEDVVDPDFRTARVSMRVPFADGSQYPAFGAELRRVFEQQLGDRADVSLNGLMVVMGQSFHATIVTMVRSYGIALGVITPLMMLLLRSARMGLVAMVPNLFPIALTMGLMGWLGIAIDTFSLLVGSVALGLAVDDTIHFMHGFRRRYSDSGDVPRAVQETLATTGQALLFTSVVLSIGFSIYLLSELSSVRNFGGLTAFAIAMAFLADVLLAPALMTYTAQWSSVARGAAAPEPEPAR